MSWQIQLASPNLMTEQFLEAKVSHYFVVDGINLDLFQRKETIPQLSKTENCYHLL